MRLDYYSCSKKSDQFVSETFVVLVVPYLTVPLVPCLTVPVVLNTWGKQTTNIEYYSEEADESIPTVDLGVSNEKSGEWE